MPSIINTYNYIVPASGTTSGYLVNLKGITNDPSSVNFSQVSQNGLPFTPSGVIVDNTNSSASMIINIVEIGFNIVVPAGKQMGLSYPAPQGHSATFSNSGNPATLIFVDYPVIPYQF